MSHATSISVMQNQDGVYVLRVGDEHGTHRYADLVDVWRALDKLDPPGDSKSTLLLQASGAAAREE
jgi:hypothetical protein